MMTRITASDGHQLDCWMQPAEGPAKGGLVIIQEIFGVTDQLKGLAQRYAANGFHVAIPALFDRRERDSVIPFDEAPRGRDLMLASDLEETMRDIDAAVSALREKTEEVAVLGFCWGGGLAIRAAQKLNIAGAVAFYGTRLPDYLDSPLQAPVLCHFGSADDHVPPQMIKQMTDYLPEVEVHMYEAGHAFANDARASFVPEAAELAHQRSEAFLDQVLGR